MLRNAFSRRNGTTGFSLLALASVWLFGATVAPASDRAVLGELFSMDN